MSEPKREAPPDENQIIAERRAKLSALRTSGHAYPNDFRRDALHERRNNFARAAFERVGHVAQAAKMFAHEPRDLGLVTGGAKGFG